MSSFCCVILSSSTANLSLISGKFAANCLQSPPFAVRPCSRSREFHGHLATKGEQTVGQMNNYIMHNFYDEEKCRLQKRNFWEGPGGAVDFGP
ncbi:hypothetical protein niasHT_032616 [Heterodera trifolii]|uniref:Uncharacterized protein n=1 Tax=Heterodera trifolii TaxID=157864 RepID=A0ABD2I6E4_9BILA